MTVAFPSSLLTKIKRFRLDFNENAASYESILTRKRQVVTLSAGTADRWEGLIETISLMSAADIRTMWSFLVKVGLTDTFTIGDPDYTGPASGQTSILVNGGSQSGTSLNCDAATPSVQTLAEGEWFQVGTEMKLVVANATANGSGQVTLSFRPALRTSPADNATVTLSNPQMLLRLTGAPSRDTDEAKIGVFALPFVEAL